MKAINFLTWWIGYLMILTPISAAAVITYQATRKSFSPDEDTINDANNKIRQTIKGAILIMCMSTTIEVIKSFYLINGDYQRMDTSQLNNQKDFVLELVQKFLPKK